MDYIKFCDEIIRLNPKVRFAGVYTIVNGGIYYKMQKGIKKIFTDEQTKDSLIHAYMRWKSRLHSSDLIGKPIYTMTKYPKLNRITLPCGGKALIMISTEPELEPSEIIDDVCKLREQYADPEGYEPAARQINF
ncbi:MAG: hypothetical protein ACREAU_05625 [Nitrosopumilaceae archaeon]